MRRNKLARLVIKFKNTMEGEMGYFYAVLWVVIGIILLTMMVKENKVFIVAGVYFIFLGLWWFINQLVEADMFKGTPGIVLRIITGIALVFFVIVFAKSYTAGRKKEKEEQAKIDAKLAARREKLQREAKTLDSAEIKDTKNIEDKQNKSENRLEKEEK